MAIATFAHECTIADLPLALALFKFVSWF